MRVTEEEKHNSKMNLLVPPSPPPAQIVVPMEKDQAETPRIDVKRDISINDKIKKKTASY